MTRHRSADRQGDGVDHRRYRGTRAAHGERAAGPVRVQRLSHPAPTRCPPAGPARRRRSCCVDVLPGEEEPVDIALRAQASLVGTVLRLADRSECRTRSNDLKAASFRSSGAHVRLFDPDDFPGTAQAATGPTSPTATGDTSFSNLPAPDDFMIAVYTDDDGLGRRARLEARPDRAQHPRCGSTIPVGQASSLTMRVDALTPVVTAAPGGRAVCRLRVENTDGGPMSYDRPRRRVRRGVRAAATAERSARRR